MLTAWRSSTITATDATPLTSAPDGKESPLVGQGSTSERRERRADTETHQGERGRNWQRRGQANDGRRVASSTGQERRQSRLHDRGQD